MRARLDKNLQQVQKTTSEQVTKFLQKIIFPFLPVAFSLHLILDRFMNAFYKPFTLLSDDPRQDWKKDVKGP